mgnify:CR=1 FL=1
MSMSPMRARAQVHRVRTGRGGTDRSHVHGRGPAGQEGRCGWERWAERCTGGYLAGLRVGRRPAVAPPPWSRCLTGVRASDHNSATAPTNRPASPLSTHHPQIVVDTPRRPAELMESEKLEIRLSSVPLPVTSFGCLSRPNRGSTLPSDPRHTLLARNVAFRASLEIDKMVRTADLADLRWPPSPRRERVGIGPSGDHGIRCPASAERVPASRIAVRRHSHGARDLRLLVVVGSPPWTWMRRWRRSRGSCSLWRRRDVAEEVCDFLAIATRRAASGRVPPVWTPPRSSPEAVRQLEADAVCRSAPSLVPSRGSLNGSTLFAVDTASQSVGALATRIRGGDHRVLLWPAGAWELAARCGPRSDPSRDGARRRRAERRYSPSARREKCQRDVQAATHLAAAFAKRDRRCLAGRSRRRSSRMPRPHDRRPR